VVHGPAYKATARDRTRARTKFCRCIVSSYFHHHQGHGVPREPDRRELHSEGLAQCSVHLRHAAAAQHALVAHDPQHHPHGHLPRPEKCLRMSKTAFKALPKSTLEAMMRALHVPVHEYLDDMTKGELQELVATHLPPSFKAFKSLDAHLHHHHKHSGR
jgi:hypothetical protein